MKKTFLSIVLMLTVCIVQAISVSAYQFHFENYQPNGYYPAAEMCDDCHIYMSEKCGGNFAGYVDMDCSITTHGEDCNVILYTYETYRYCSSCGKTAAAMPHYHGYEHSYDGIFHYEKCDYSSAVASIDPTTN